MDYNKLQNIYEDINKKNTTEIYSKALNDKTTGRRKDISKLPVEEINKKRSDNLPGM